MNDYQKLEARFRQHSRLRELQSISQWDEAVVMPAGGGEARANSLSELSSILQNLISAKEVGDWIEGASNEQSSLGPWQRANLAEMKREYLNNTAVPVELNQKLVVAIMRSEQAWRKMRGENNWKDFQPYMQEVISLTREKLQILSGLMNLSLYDTALSLYSKGLDCATIDRLFNELKSFLPGVIPQVVEKQKREELLVPEGNFPMLAQKALGLELMKAVGFNLQHGRLDESHHPFCGGTPRDVRITTRYRENEFLTSLMGVLHETGHALYEQNLPPEWVEQPVGNACGMAIHESQSLIMEMQVVRSAEFLEFAAPLIRKHMGAYVTNPKSLETGNLLKLVSRVNPGYIRVDADEVTYPSHVILRYEIERDLLDDKWPLAELPAVWDQKMKAYLGLSTLGNDKNGCMQDVHWPAGLIGYFPAYTFGAVIAAHLFAKAHRVRPSIRQEISTGNFSGLQTWLGENVWHQGSRMDTLQLVENAAGPLSSAAFRTHIQSRYF